MTFTSQTAKHLKDVYFGGNWTSVNYKNTLSEIDWKEATIKIEGCNTIATLVYHTNYYIEAVTKVLKGKPLNAKDEFSFETPPITSEEDWRKLIEKSLNDAHAFTELIQKLPETILQEDFTDNKYGNYFRNLHGIIEHCHYHLGQIVILKKLITNNA